MSRSTMLRSWSFQLLAVVLCFVVAGTASAGTISGVQMFGLQAGTGSGLGTVSVPIWVTPNPNNDNQVGGGPADNNITVPVKRFDKPGEIDIVFHVQPSNGVTEYKVFESVDNNTFINWSDYRMQLGFGTGASFVPTLPGSGLDFDFPTFDTFPASSAFSTVLPGENVLAFTTGIHSSGSETYQFRIDVPDLSPTGAIESFTLRQVPVAVPEPSSFLLLLSAVACFGLSRARLMARR
ncbi:MAG: choice-of-anchor F family protein [Pirellulales bacterium]